MENNGLESNANSDGKESRISLTTFILSVLFTLPMITSLVGLFMMLGEIKSFEDFRITVFPFLFKNVGIMGILLVLIFLNLYRENRKTT